MANMSDSNNNVSKSFENQEPLVLESNFKPRKRKKKAREVNYIPYSEDNAGSGEEDIYKQQSNQAESLENDHMHIRNLIEERRRTFGSGWLLSNISPSLLPVVHSTENSQLANRPGDNGQCNNSLPASDLEDLKIDIQATAEKRCVERTPSVTSPGIYSSSSASVFSPASTEESESETEDGDESELFFAHQPLGDTPLMLTLGSTCFVEKDGLSGKKNHSWLLSSLTSAELLQEDDVVCVDLTFDVIRRDKQQRTYKMESNQSAKMFLELLEPALCKNSHLKANEGALQCLKCESKFSKSLVQNVILQKAKEDFDEFKKVKLCPNCKSTALVEILQKSTNSVSDDSKVPKPENSMKQIEQQFISSAIPSPRMRARSISVVTRMRQTSLSGGRGEEGDSTSSSSIECILSGTDEKGEGSTLRSQSDITVLSNPSQSSIAVISQSSSSISASSNQDLAEARKIGHFTSQNSPSRTISSPVDISQPLYSPSRESPWYDSSSAKTAFLHSPSSKVGEPTECGNSLTSNSPTLRKSSATTREEESRWLWQLLEHEDDITKTGGRINHQIKLHIEVNVFQDGEDFLTGINGNVVLDATRQEVPGILIVSTENVYLFKGSCNNNNNTDDGSEIEEIGRHSLKSLTDVYTLLGSQGFGLSFSSETSAQRTVLIILRNADICNNFVISLEGILKTNFSHTSAHTRPRFQLLTKEILHNVQTEIIQASTGPGTESDQSVRLFLLGSVQRPLESKKPVDPVAFVVTCQCLYLARVLYFTQVHDPILHFQLIESQEIGNLTEVHLTEDMSGASFHFLDEDLGQEEFWLFSADSRSSMASLLNTLKSPWEELFGIEFQIAHNKTCICGL